MKNLGFCFVILSFGLLALNFFGCASAPSVKESLPTYNLNGTTYYPLLALCSARGINWQYDAFSRVMVLNRDAHKVSLRAGDNLVLADGNVITLDKPIDIYLGAIVVPIRFKESVIDSLFKEYIPAKTAVCPGTKIRKVVIDPGHGGRDPGATGRTGLFEKDINLDIAKRLAEILRSDGIQVIITRTSDIFVPLPTRARIANSSGADLFISIHSNANRVKSMKGFEAYYVAPTVSDSSRALVSAKSANLNLDNNCIASQSQDLKATLWDMVYTNARAESIELANGILRSMDDNLDAKGLGIKGARFEVLREVNMPAVLMEVGFVSNIEEERMLKNSFYRQKIAESIAQGVCDYAKDSTITETVNR